jgi:hypothetical protein
MDSITGVFNSGKRIVKGEKNKDSEPLQNSALIPTLIRLRS